MIDPQGSRAAAWDVESPVHAAVKHIQEALIPFVKDELSSTIYRPFPEGELSYNVYKQNVDWLEPVKDRLRLSNPKSKLPKRHGNGSIGFDFSPLLNTIIDYKHWDVFRRTFAHREEFSGIPATEVKPYIESLIRLRNRLVRARIGLVVENVHSTVANLQKSVFSNPQFLN